MFIRNPYDLVTSLIAGRRRTQRPDDGGWPRMPHNSSNGIRLILRVVGRVVVPPGFESLAVTPPPGSKKVIQRPIKPPLSQALGEGGLEVRAPLRRYSASPPQRSGNSGMFSQPHSA